MDISNKENVDHSRSRSQEGNRQLRYEGPQDFAATSGSGITNRKRTAMRKLGVTKCFYAYRTFGIRQAVGDVQRGFR